MGWYQIDMKCKQVCLGILGAHLLNAFSSEEGNVSIFHRLRFCEEDSLLVGNAPFLSLILLVGTASFLSLIFCNYTKKAFPIRSRALKKLEYTINSVDTSIKRGLN